MSSRRTWYFNKDIFLKHMINWVKLRRRSLNCFIKSLTALQAGRMYVQMTDRDSLWGERKEGQPFPALSFCLVSRSQGCWFKTSGPFLLGNSTRESVFTETLIPMTWNNKVRKHGSPSPSWGREREWGEEGSRWFQRLKEWVASNYVCFLSFPLKKKW